MIRKLLIVPYCWLVVGYVQAQVPRDTSYTLRSAYEKVKKHHADQNASPVYSQPSSFINVRKEVVYRTIDDRELLANLFYPKKNGVYPGLLMVHGGGWRAGDKSLMTPMAERFAEAGYAVMVPEYRLSLEAPYPAAVYDLKAALRWMRENAIMLGLNIGEIAILGCSAGGQLAALVGTTNNDPKFEGIYDAAFSSSVQAIVDIDGVLAFVHPQSQEGSMAAQWLGGTSKEIPKLWKEASALSHVGGDTPPTLFLASKYPRFLAGHKEYSKVLRECAIYEATNYFPEAPHSFWLFHPWFEPTVAYVLGFLEIAFDENEGE